MTLNYKEGEDYKLVFKEGSEFYSIRMLKGEYQDVIFTFGKVALSEDKKNDKATLKFDWKLEEKPETIEEDLNSSSKFQNLLGDLLTDLILESKKFDAGKHTNDNTQDTDSE